MNGWNKSDGDEWQKLGDTFKAEITRYRGGAVPYCWDVYPMPRRQHLDDSGAWRPLNAGSERTLALAKAAADREIEAWTA